MATNAGCVPAVGRPRERQPQLGRGLAGLVVEIPQHLEVVGDESGRATTTALDAVGGQRAQVVVDVRLEPRHLRRPGPRLPDQVELGARPAHRLGHQPGGFALLARHTALPSGPDASFIATGIECAVNTSRAVSAGPTANSASAARTPSALAAMKPGWSK